MRLSDFNYELPPEMIAQTPIEPRNASRLLVAPRQGGDFEHRHFSDLPEYLRPGDVLVLNQTRVIPARLQGIKQPTGGAVEILLLRQQDETTWVALVGGKRVRPGTRISITGAGGPAANAEIVAELDGAQRLVRFDVPLHEILALPVRFRSRPTSTSRWPIRSATRRCSPAMTVRPRPPLRTSLHR
jgi:S-adenosylmethionine:tRNA ribosyltransferase-isomerase